MRIIYIIILLLTISCTENHTDKVQEYWLYYWQVEKYRYPGIPDTDNKDSLYIEDSLIVDTIIIANKVKQSLSKNDALNAMHRLDSVSKLHNIDSFSYKIDTFGSNRNTKKFKIFHYAFPEFERWYSYKGKIYKSKSYSTYINKGNNYMSLFYFDIIPEFGIWHMESSMGGNHRRDFYHDPEFYRLIKVKYIHNATEKTIVDISDFPYRCYTCYTQSIPKLP